MVINKFPNREVYEKIKEKGSLGADDVNVLEDYPGLEWKGEYSSTATYVKGDIVYYENMLYVMASASVIGAIPGIDNDWIDFAKRSVTSSDVTNALGFTPADSTKVLPLSGGTLTGNLTGKYIIGTWLQATDAGHLATTPTKILVFDNKGWIYYRTPAEILKDIGASSGYTLTEADKTEIAGKVVADGTEFALSDFPTALKNPNALTFTGAATGTYDGSAALTVNIPAGGASGTDLSLGVTGATVGQIAKITAVDASGKPTAWKPVDMPSGGGETWEEIRTLEISEDIVKTTISTDNDGAPFSLKKIYIEIKVVPPTNTDITYNATVCCAFNGNDPWGARKVNLGESPKTGESHAILMISGFDSYAGKIIPVFVKAPDGQLTANILTNGRGIYDSRGAFSVGALSDTNVPALSPCRSIEIGSYRLSLFAGTTIKIYGVRA